MQDRFCYFKCYVLGVSSEDLIGFQVLQEDRAVMTVSVTIFRKFLVRYEEKVTQLQNGRHTVCVVDMSQTFSFVVANDAPF